MCDNNRCLSNWATVVCQKEELSTHWISLYLSYSQGLRFNSLVLAFLCPVAGQPPAGPPENLKGKGGGGTWLFLLLYSRYKS